MLAGHDGLQLRAEGTEINFARVQAGARPELGSLHLICNYLHPNESYKTLVLVQTAVLGEMCGVLVENARANEARRAP